jgi:hypothetical protein
MCKILVLFFVCLSIRWIVVAVGTFQRRIWTWTKRKQTVTLELLDMTMCFIWQWILQSVNGEYRFKLVPGHYLKFPQSAIISLWVPLTHVPMFLSERLEGWCESSKVAVRISLEHCVLLCDTYSRPARCVVNSSWSVLLYLFQRGQQFTTTRKGLEQQILFWAVREHAEDICERKENWKILLLDCRHLQEVNWLGLRRKRLSALSARNVTVTAALQSYKTDAFHECHDTDSETRWNFVKLYLRWLHAREINYTFF